VVKLQTFNEKVEKVSEFLMVCRLYIKIRMRDAMGFIVCARRISEYIERKYYGEFRK